MKCKSFENSVGQSKRRGKKIVRILLWILVIFVVLLMLCLGYHKYRLAKEEELREPLGELVDVKGNNMSINVEGNGPKTLVFLSGGGTCSPILDFKSLYSLLSDEYQIVVVEKFGYGFSDVVKEDRDIKTILSETRMALTKAGIEGPYVLCPHSMSGIEALYWAQTYPDEVEAINAALVEKNGVPEVPMLLFITDGSGGTGFEKETWRSIPETYISGVKDGKYIELDCPHYVHDYEYQRISEEIKNYLHEL